MVDRGPDCSPRLRSFALLATDGLWDVLSNDEAVQIARRVQTAHGSGASSSSRPWHVEAAELLVDEALVRSTLDNVGCLVVPLLDQGGAGQLVESDG